MKTKKVKGLPCSNMREFDAIMDGTTPKPQHTPTPWNVVTVTDERRQMVSYEIQGANWTKSEWMTPELIKANAAYIVKCVNAHEELLRLAMILVSNIELMRDKGALLPSDNTLTAMNIVRDIAQAEGK